LKRSEYNKAVHQHADQLFGYAIRFLRNREDARDVVQDVFEKLCIHRKKVELPQPKAWLFKTAHNTMINLINRKERIQLPGDHFLPEMVRKDVSFFESGQVVDIAVNILPPIQRSIILLRDIEGYSYEDIGEILSLSSSQVKVYRFRARHKIKKQLKGLKELV
jgi:RNA polymerase sigma factor (sigma-70 family)